MPDPNVLDLLVHPLKQPVKTADSIIDVLKYSQRDLDAALQKAERQVCSHSLTQDDWDICLIGLSNCF